MLVACGATQAAVLPPECMGEGEEGAVAEALRTFHASPDGTALDDSAVLFNATLSCRVATARGVLTVRPYTGHPSFALSCWARGGPEDGQCQPCGRDRGLAPAIAPPPPEGAHDFGRSWLLWAQGFEGDAVVVVTVGGTAQGYQAVVVRRDGVWDVVYFDLAWVT